MNTTHCFPTWLQYCSVTDWGKYFSVSLLQAIWVFVVSLPVVFVNAPTSKLKPNAYTFTRLDIAGSVIFSIGFLCESSADLQKFYWKQKPENKGKWCMFGMLIQWLVC